MKNIYYFTLTTALLLSACQGLKESQSEDKDEPAMKGKYIFSGNYTRKEGHVDGKAKGIEVYKINDGASLELLSIATDAVNPSYLALSANGKYLYAVNETGPDMGSSGTISSYSVNGGEKTLNLINKVSSHSYAPCYISLDSQNRMAFVVNYLGGIVAVYPINEDGSLEEASQVITLEGSGSHERQDSSHPHSIVLSPDEQFAYVPDLGTDKIMIYKIKYDSSRITPATVPYVTLDGPSGPRHAVFHPDGKYFYVISELNNTVSFFEQDSQYGDLRLLQTISTLPWDFSGTSMCADIHITEDGKFLYGTNRGHNSIVIFSIDQGTGTLELIGHESTRGDFPRNFMIDGTDLYVANQNSDNIVHFKITSSGELEFLSEYEAKTPVCLKSFEYLE